MILDAVIAYEGGAWEKASKLAARAGVDPSILPTTYTAALPQEVVRGGITSPAL